MNAQGSFWQAFGQQLGGAHEIEKLLQREDLCFEELLDQELVIQECKYVNPQLIE